MTDDEPQEGSRLARWSQRKRGVVREDEPVELSAEEAKAEEATREAELAANRKAAEEIDLDTIDADSDLSLFMKEGVPAALKKAALAKLWRSDPVFANVDGLVEYGENYADPSLVMKTFTSAYQVGKGYLKEVLEEDEEAAVASADFVGKEPEQDPNEKATEDEASEVRTAEDNTETEPVAAQSNVEPELPEPETGVIEADIPPEAPVTKVSLRQRMGV